jgi:hypothetical protein
VGSFEVASKEDVVGPVSADLVPFLTVTGAVAVPAGYMLDRVDVTYRWPIVHAFVSVLSDSYPSPTLAYSLPDLTSAADLCIEASALPGTISSRVCGGSIAGSSASIQLQPEPTFVGAVDGTSLSGTTTWDWTPFDNGVYVVDLTSDTPSATTPDLHIVTGTRSLHWADLVALGAPFTRGASYAVTLSGAGPFASLDDACGPAGMGASFPSEQRWSYAPPVSVTVAP